MRAATFILIALPLLAAEWLAVRAGTVAGAAGGFPPGLAVLACAAGLVGAIGLRRAPPAAPASRMATAFEFATVLFCLLGPVLGRFEVPVAFLLFALLGIRLLGADQFERRAAAVAVGLDFALEAILVHSGAHTYQYVLAAPLPLWLPAMWANLGIAARRLYARFATRPLPPPSVDLQP